MKTLFWKRVLSPLRLKAAELLWLFDCDIATHPSLFPLGQLAAGLIATNASVLQPAVRGWNGRGSHHAHLAPRAVHLSCYATTVPFIELQTPFFRADAWAAFHTGVLAHIPDRHLATSDHGTTSHASNLPPCSCGRVAACHALYTHSLTPFEF